jgi:DNA repair exonuclease SbcCD ATPase subunit
VAKRQEERLKQAEEAAKRREERQKKAEEAAKRREERQKQAEEADRRWEEEAAKRREERLKKAEEAAAKRQEDIQKKAEEADRRREVKEKAGRLRAAHVYCVRRRAAVIGVFWLVKEGVTVGAEAAGYPPNGTRRFLAEEYGGSKKAMEAATAYRQSEIQRQVDMIRLKKAGG